MNKTHTAIIILLVIAIGLGAINLKIYSTLNGRMQPTTSTGAVLDDANIVHNSNGVLVSLDGSKLVLSVGSKKTTLTLAASMKYYLRNVMSDAKYQEAVKNYQANPILERTGNATSGTIAVAPAPKQDVYNQEKGIEDLKLKAGDVVVVTYKGNFVDGTVLSDIVKVVEIK